MTTLDQQQSTNHESALTQPTLDWIDIVKRWKKSGLSQTAYCKANNISVNQFTYQQAKLSARTQSSAKLLPVNIVPSEIPLAAQNNFVLHYPTGIKLHIPINAHPEAIKTLLACLVSR
jgi:hypothetical protein